MKKRCYDKSLDSYISEAKVDILIYFVVFLIIFSVGFYFSYRWGEYIFLIFLGIWFLISLLGRVQVLYNVSKTKKYLVSNHLIDKIGKIVFWDNDSYFLTDSYFIIVYQFRVHVFSYDDILSIKKEVCYRRHDSSDHLYITLKNQETFPILIDSYSMTISDNKDISKFLLSKNPDILVEEVVVDWYGVKL